MEWPRTKGFGQIIEDIKNRLNSRHETEKERVGIYKRVENFHLFIHRKRKLF
jgi:hypothetical protein